MTSIMIVMEVLMKGSPSHLPPVQQPKQASVGKGLVCVGKERLAVHKPLIHKRRAVIDQIMTATVSSMKDNVMHVALVNPQYSLKRAVMEKIKTVTDM